MIAHYDLALESSAEDDASVFGRPPLGGVYVAPLQDGDPVDRQQRQCQLGDGGERSHRAAGHREEAVAEIGAACRLLRTFGHDGAPQGERGEERLEKARLLSVRLYERDGYAERDPDGNCRKARAAADVGIGFPRKRRHGEAVEDMGGDVGGILRAGQVKMGVRGQDAAAELGEPA